MISIVTAYYNRKKLFYRTLLKLKNSGSSDFEVIAVDDGSSEENRLEDIQSEFPFLKIIRLEKENKWYKNPCIPFNIGFKQALGDIVIIQNPECLHFGNVLDFVKFNLKKNEYLSFACYSLDQVTTDKLETIPLLDNEIERLFKPRSEVIRFEGDDGWYNHPIMRPVGYHFCSAINKCDLEDLGGFDERYAKGIAFDDDEFFWRIKQKGMNVVIVDNPIVLHQNHYIPGSPVYSTSKYFERNKRLFENFTKLRKTWRVNRGHNSYVNRIFAGIGDFFAKRFKN